MMQRVVHAIVVTFLAAGVVTAGEPSNFETRFTAACRELLQSEHYGRGRAALVVGHDRWVLLADEVEYASLGTFWGDAASTANPLVSPALADPLPVLKSFNEQLAQRGVELVLVPVPVRPLVYPETVLGDDSSVPPNAVFDSAHSRFLKVLAASGVTTVDLLPAFRSHRRDERGTVFCRSDSHWTGTGVVLAAQEIARLVAARPWVDGVEKVDLRARWSEQRHTGSFFHPQRELMRSLDLGSELLQVRVVDRVTPEGSEPLAMRNPSSPVAVIGDSFTVWGESYQASIIHQLTYELGFPVDRLGMEGGGPTKARVNLVREARANPGYLDGKRVVVWCLSAKVLGVTGDGWRPVPFAK